MACLIKDVITGQIIGYETLTEEQRLRINEEGSYKATPFYDINTCKAVINSLEGRA